MAYVGNQPAKGQFRKLTDISGSFDGVTTTFTTSVPPGTSSYYVTAGSASQLLVSLGGVIQQPDTDYTVSTNSITFTTAPASGLSFFGVLMGDALNTGTPADGSVTTSKLASDLTVDLASGSVSAPSLTFDANTGLYSPAADKVAISTNGTDAVIVDDSQRLLVGTSTSTEANALIQAYKASGVNYVNIQSDSLANGQPVAVIATSASRSGIIGVYKHSGITNPCAYMLLVEEDGASQNFWVDNSGNFRISTSLNHVGTTSGTVVGTQTSDERLKNILGPVEYGLDSVKQIEPVRYTLKSEPDTEKLGFIAQQVLPIIPQSVFDTGEEIGEGEPTKLGMEYVTLIPVLVNAIKELSAEVDALKAQLA